MPQARRRRDQHEPAGAQRVHPGSLDVAHTHSLPWLQADNGACVRARSGAACTCRLRRGCSLTAWALAGAAGLICRRELARLHDRARACCCSPLRAHAQHLALCAATAQPLQHRRWRRATETTQHCCSRHAPRAGIGAYQHAPRAGIGAYQHATRSCRHARQIGRHTAQQTRGACCV
jgi:hypothetical protein